MLQFNSENLRLPKMPMFYGGDDQPVPPSFSNSNSGCLKIDLWVTVLHHRVQGHLSKEIPRQARPLASRIASCFFVRCMFKNNNNACGQTFNQEVHRKVNPLLMGNPGTSFGRLILLTGPSKAVQ